MFSKVISLHQNACSLFLIKTIKLKYYINHLIDLIFLFSEMVRQFGWMRTSDLAKPTAAQPSIIHPFALAVTSKLECWKCMVSWVPKEGKDNYISIYFITTATLSDSLPIYVLNAI
jgi:hypothetical protein